MTGQAAIHPRLDRFLSTREICELTSWSRSTLWREWKANRFPAPVETAPQRVGWPESEVVAWQEAKIANRDERQQRRDPSTSKTAPKAKRQASRAGKQTVH